MQGVGRADPVDNDGRISPQPCSSRRKRVSGFIIFAAFPCLPEVTCREAWAELKRIAPDTADIADFVEYMERNYMGANAQYPPSQWCLAPSNDSVVQRTTNPAEGFHSYLRRAFTKAHPRPPEFCKKLKTIQSASETSLNSVDAGIAATSQSLEPKRLVLYQTFMRSDRSSPRLMEYIERTGMVDAGELLKITTFDRLLRYWVQEYEELTAYRLPACGVDKTCTIIDLKGLGLKQFTPQVKNMMQKLAKVANDNYPEVLGTMFVVNAPFIFTAIWKVVSPMVDPITRSKIVVLGSNYKPTLHNVVDPSQLPDFLGGTCTACDDVRGGCMYSNMGPWVAYKKEKEEERRLKSTGGGSPKYEGSAMPSTTRSHSGSFDDFISLVSSDEYRDYVSCCSFTPISRKASEDVVASGKIMNSTTLKPPPSAITESIQSSSVAVEIGTTSHFARASDEDIFSSVAGSALGNGLQTMPSTPDPADNSASPIPRSGGTSHRRKKASFTAKWLSCFACHSSAASADIVSPRNKAEGAGQQPST
ncbi:cytosolic factor, phosphatidylinositol/phosphatidylcholine transfer protein [Perkinsus olseni]|uniref:Cytosolic factor, phosphatidylinositol/phosphatidylcholine transfer protein n=1 Tax=Perkinsus olseni TaxID=32597 RepID=A0A7J6NEG5_PEROL|nr:cytosolic factor, phosphatidylinositol/phosphatidylcholine transfer protein [Perkinsus olseni]